VRGFRIELGEIEAALCELLEVQQAVVVPSSRDGEEQRLVGYIVTHPGFAPTTSELRRQLKEQLPEYMIPSAFVRLDKISRTANGKIDRRSLPDPEDVPADLESIYLAPRTPVEEELTRIWSQLLVLNRVGVNDNFFDLGGHSLLATQIISRVRETFQVELPLRELFESPTVAGLAARVELASRGEGVIERLELLRQVKQGLTAPPILPVARDGALPLSFAQQRLWFLDQLAPGSSAYNIIGGMRLEGELDVAALEQALNEIVCRHEALRTTFTTVDGRLVQVITAGQPIALTLIDLRVLDEHRREERVRELAREELNRSFDLRQGPLLRVSLLRLRDDEHVALVTMHHIVSDGWSTAIFIKDS
jgi:Acyl-coenzyme A synthetases/AMP-(fatty) acid ligases